MFDYNNHLSGEIRHLAFKKSLKQGVWQDAIRQQQEDEKHLHKINWLSDFSNTMMLQLSLWRQHFISSREDHFQAEQDLTILRSNAPENH